jgi:excisionase family DNA binding protein
MPQQKDGTSMSGRFLKKHQVAEWLQVTTRTVDDYMKRGLLPFYKLGRTVRFNQQDVETVLRRTCLVGRRVDWPLTKN